jgi:hypothetical protein
MSLRWASRPTTNRPIRRGHRGVHGRRVGQLEVDGAQGLRLDPDTGVGDLDDQAAVAVDGRGQHDRRVRRGEVGGVVQQLGHEVDEVVHRRAGDRDRRRAAHDDALVVLDLGDRGAQHVLGRDRAPPARAQLRGAREDQQVLVVPPHAGGEVVELEQIAEVVGVLLVALQLVDQAQLPLHQALAAPGQVDEDVVDVRAEQGLLARQPDGLGVHRVERPRHLADLLVGVDADRFDRHLVLRVAGVLHPLDGLRQPALGDVERGGAQAAQRPDHRPGHQHQHGHGQHDREDDRQDVQRRVAARLRRQRRRVGAEPALQVGLDLADQLGRATVGGVQPVEADAGDRPVEGERGERALLDALPVVDLGTAHDLGEELLCRRLAGGAELGDGGVELGGAGAGQVLLGRRGAVRGRGGGRHQRRVLELDLLLGLADEGQVRGFLGQLLVLHRQRGAAQREHRVHDVGVGVEHRVGLELAVGGGVRGAQLGDSAQPDERGVRDGRCAGSEVGRVGGQQGSGGLVDGGELLLQVAAVRAAPGGDVGGDHRPLELQLVQQRGDLLGEADPGDLRAEVRCGLLGARDAQATEDPGEQQRDDQDDDQLAAQAPVAQQQRRATASGGRGRRPTRAQRLGTVEGSTIRGPRPGVPTRGSRRRSGLDAHVM